MSAPRRLSASARVLFAMAGMLVTAIALLVVLAYAVTWRTLTASLDETLARESQAYSAAMRGAPRGAALTDATRAYLSGRTGGGAGGLSPILLARFDNGRVISNSDVRIEAAAGSPATSTVTPTYVTVTLDGVTYRVLAAPLFAQGARAGLFEAALSLGPVQRTASNVATTLSAAGLVALAIMLPLAYFATRRALSPLTQMAENAAVVSHARPGRRIDYDGPDDELGSLARSLNSMLQRLEHAFEDQRRFVADASHELRTPVAVIRGNVELLRSGRATGPEAEESLAMVEAEAVRMTRLLDDMLSLARLEDPERVQFQPLNAATLVEECAARARTLADRDIVRSEQCEMWVDGDPDLLERALLNLVKNAIAHTETGGRIEIGCEASGRHVVITVTDDGPGIAAQDLERVFDRFYRAHGSYRDEAGGGAGLGLAIVRQLVELHGGSVRADNVDPHGARFFVELPSIEPPAR